MHSRATRRTAVDEQPPLYRIVGHHRELMRLAAKGIWGRFTATAAPSVPPSAAHVESQPSVAVVTTQPPRLCSRTSGASSRRATPCRVIERKNTVLEAFPSAGGRGPSPHRVAALPFFAGWGEWVRRGRRAGTTSPHPRGGGRLAREVTAPLWLRLSLLGTGRRGGPHRRAGPTAACRAAASCSNAPYGAGGRPCNSDFGGWRGVFFPLPSGGVGIYRGGGLCGSGARRAAPGADAPQIVSGRGGRRASGAVSRARPIQVARWPRGSSRRPRRSGRSPERRAAPGAIPPSDPLSRGPAP